MRTNPGLEYVEAEVNETLNMWRGDGSIFWDEELDAWIVTGYDESASILEDAKRFERDIPLREGALEFWGRNHLLMLQGRDHRKLHAAHMKLTGEKFAEEIRQSLIRKVADDLSAKLVCAGKADLAKDYATKIPLYIGCGYLGVDLNDHALIERLSTAMPTRGAWKEALLSGSGVPLTSKVAQDGLAALQEIGDALLPTIRARRDDPQDDLISAFWREGQKIFPDWNEKDMVTSCYSNLDNETNPLLRGLLYTLCQDWSLQSSLRDDPSLVPAYVEEGLRYFTPFRTIRRIALEDVPVNGEIVHKGDSLYLVTPLAHRDKEKWGCPHTFSPSRPETQTILSFGLGTGYCVGRYLGRVEAVEAVRALLAATSSIELDASAAEKPVWSGEMYHFVSPIHVVFK